MASAYGHIEYALEYDADRAHTEERCRDALKARIDHLDGELAAMKLGVIGVIDMLRARDRGTQRGLQWAYDAASALEKVCGVPTRVKNLSPGRDEKQGP
jgi:predicted NBD/HSP70 family sugar kinase